MTSLPRDPRDLPETVRVQLDAASRAEPPPDLLDAVVTEVGRAPQARTWWSVPRVAVGLGTVGVAIAAVVLAVFVAGGGRPGAPGPVRDTASKDGFVLELTVAQSSYAPNAPIDAHATLTYTGSQPISRVWGGGKLVLFSLVEVDGSRDVPGAMDLPCIPYPITPGEPQTFPFTKSGGYSASDPNAAFVEAYLHDPQLRLPSGTWELQAQADFDIGEGCTAHGIKLTTAVHITVGGSAPTALPSQSSGPTTTAHATRTPAPSATFAVPTQPPAEATSTWAPVTMPSRAADGPVGGPQGGVAAVPGGGFIDFVVEAPDRVSVYRSADGARWHRDGEIASVGADGISGPIARLGSMYVALGTEVGGINYASQSNGAAWVSNDLLHWTKVPAQDAFGGVSFVGIAAGPTRLVAIGQSQGEIAVCWTSPDGLHWTPVLDSTLFPPDSQATAIAWISDHFLVVGTHSGAPAAWISHDGARWIAVSSLPETSATILSGLAAGRAGLVTLATGGPAIEVAPGDSQQEVFPWTSADGEVWQPRPASSALFGANAALVPAPGGYVAAGTLGSAEAGYLWTSIDGVSWTPVAGVDLRAASEMHLLSDGRHVLLFGRSSDGGAFAFVSDGVHA